MNFGQFKAFLREYSLEIYVTLVLAVGAWALLRMLFSLRRASAGRKRRLRRRRRSDQLDRLPFEDSVDVAHERGLESIEKNFTITRRLLAPLIVILTVALASLPLLSSVPATVLSAVIAVITVVLGVAARPLIENAMSGLVISYSKLVNIGDAVRVEDMYGTVEDIHITHTTIKLWDWRRFVVPNSRMIQQSFYNHSVVDKFEWANVEFWVAYGTDLDQVEELAIAAATASDACTAEYEAPRMWVLELEKEGIRCRVAAWADTPALAWALRNDMRIGLIKRFNAAGISSHLNQHAVRNQAA